MPRKDLNFELSIFQEQYDERELNLSANKFNIFSCLACNVVKRLLLNAIQQNVNSNLDKHN